MTNHRKVFIDLFAGCGGLSLGMEQAGFTPVFANEIWEPAATTCRMNRGLTEKQMFVGDIYLVEHLTDFTTSEESKSGLWRTSDKQRESSLG